MKKSFSIFCLASVIVLLSCAVNPAAAEVYINYLPEDITINEGDPLDVPVFFWGHNFIGRPVELLIWKETIDSSGKEYLGSGGWTPFTDITAIQPALSINSMIEYANIRWRAFGSTTGMTSFTLNICMRDMETNFELCSQRKININ